MQCGEPEVERPKRRERRDAGGEGDGAGVVHPVIAAWGGVEWRGGEGRGVMAGAGGGAWVGNKRGKAGKMGMGTGRAIQVTGGWAGVDDSDTNIPSGR